MSLQFNGLLPLMPERKLRDHEHILQSCLVFLIEHIHIGREVGQRLQEPQKL